MKKPINRVVSMSAPALATMSRRILSRMMKQKDENPQDQRRFFIFIDRLLDAMNAEEQGHAIPNLSNSH